MTLGVSADIRVPSYPALPPEASSHSASVPAMSPHPQDPTRQNQTSSTDMDSGRAEGVVQNIHVRLYWGQSSVVTLYSSNQDNPFINWLLES